MDTKLVTVIAVSALTLGLGACTTTPSQPGTYERTTSSTDANGTTYEQQSKTDVSYDENGNKKVVKKSKTTKDPKGLLNKTTTSKTNEEIETK